METKTLKKNEDLGSLDGISRIGLIAKKDGSKTSLRVRTPVDLPKEIEGKNLDVTLPASKSNTPVSLYYARQGALSYEFSSVNGKAELNGWSRQPHIQSGFYAKKELLELTHKKTGQSFVAVPVMDNHFEKNNPSTFNKEGHVLIPKDVFEHNPGWGVTLDHKQIPIVKKDDKWIIDPASRLSNAIDFKGSLKLTHPDEIYLVSKEELAEYKTKGPRNAWQGTASPLTDGTLVFSKFAKDSSGIRNEVEKRYAKPITVEGEQMYVLSNQKNMAGISIRGEVMADNQNKDNSSDKEIPKTEAAQVTGSPLQQKAEEIYDHLKTRVSDSDRGGLKAEFEELKQIIEKYQGTPDKIIGKLDLRANESISEAGKVLFKTIADSIQSNSQEKETKNKTGSSRNNFKTPAEPTRGPQGQEVVASNVAGMVAGTISGGANVLGSALKGLGGGLSEMVKLHHDRKTERLNNPELVAKEREQGAINLQTWRADKAEKSNSKMEGMMASALQSVSALSKNPGVKRIRAMVEDDPSRLEEAQDLMADHLATHPELQDHQKNVQQQTKNITKSMRENLEKNQLAGIDLEDRKGKITDFHKKMSDNPLSDILPDDEDSQTKLSENLAKLMSQLAKFMKEMFMKLKSGRSDEAQESSAAVSM